MKKRRGSLTVEATIILPFYILTLFFVLNFMNIFYMQLVIQQGLNSTATTIGKYCNVAAVTIGMDSFTLDPDTGEAVGEVMEPMNKLLENLSEASDTLSENGFTIQTFQTLTEEIGPDLVSNSDALGEAVKDNKEAIGKGLPNMLIAGGVELVGSVGVTAVMDDYLTKMNANRNLLDGDIHYFLALDPSGGSASSPDIVLTAQYRYKDPMFSVFFDTIDMKQSVVVHPWVGGSTDGLRGG